MSTTLEQIQYGFDRDSRRTWKRRALAAGEDDHYRYDALSQVTAAARGNLNLNLTAIGGRPASEQSWDYDPTGNWRGFDASENGNPVLDQHRVHDRGNRLTQIEGSPAAVVLDRAGRMRQAAPDAGGDWNGKLELTWDAWSRVTSVKNNGATVSEYEYDGLTRRTTRTAAGVQMRSYYSDAWRPLEERKDAGTTASAQYLWGARHRDDLVRRDRAVGGTPLNETRYVLMDYFSAAAIADEDGEVKERYAYSAFGVRRILTPEFAPRPTSDCAFEFGFQGQFLDIESGLYNYGYRSYSPHLGRWTCKDPIVERGGINLYGMVRNDGVNRWDRLGLKSGCSQDEVDKIIAGDDFIKGISANLEANKKNGLENCDSPTVECKCCEKFENGKIPGGYQQGSKIVICSNGPARGKDSLADYLRHEFVHAYDRCSGKGGDCDDAVCTEIRAYIMMNADTSSKEEIKTRVKASIDYRKECAGTFETDFEKMWPGCSDSAKNAWPK